MRTSLRRAFQTTNEGRPHRTPVHILVAILRGLASPMLPTRENIVAARFGLTALMLKDGEGIYGSFRQSLTGTSLKTDGIDCAQSHRHSFRDRVRSMVWRRLSGQGFGQWHTAKMRLAIYTGRLLVSSVSNRLIALKTRVSKDGRLIALPFFSFFSRRTG